MIAALRYERVRLSTLRSTGWLIGLALGLNAVVVSLFAWFTRDDSFSAALTGNGLTGFSAISPLPFTALFMAIVGIFAAGHEYRYGTIQPVLTAVPRRGHLFTAKAITVTVTAAFIAVVSMVVNWVAMSALRSEIVTVDPVVSDNGLAYVALTVGWALLGLGLAFLLRGVPSAIVIIFVIPLVVEPLLIGLSNIPSLDWLGDVAPYLPFSAGQRMLGSDATMNVDMGQWASGAVFGAFVALVLAAAWTLFQRRDA